MGFYDLFNIDFGKKIGEAKPNSKYVPITRIRFDYDFYETIDEKAKSLANLLNFDKDLSQFLEYAFVETIRNTYEHSKAEEVFVCAQKWPTMDLVEIAIVDRGCGVAQAMSRLYKERTEEELMQLALQPGVSAKSNHAYLDKNDYWRNSGYGLYILNELAPIYNGSFLFCSGGVALHNTINGIKLHSTLYQGTAIAIRIRTDTDNNFNVIRRQVLQRGEKQAHHIEGAIKRASKSSGGFYG